MAAILAAAADILFYDRYPGISVALFMLLLAGGVWYVNRLQFRDPAVRSAMILTGAGCLALIENVSWLSGAFALAGLVTLATPHRASWYRDGVRWLAVLFKFARRGWLLPFKDSRIYRMALKKDRHTPMRKLQLVGWVLPLGVSLVFIGLFADANPIISDWLAAITDFELPGPGRMFFWLAAAFLCWPFIRPRLARFGRVSTTFNPNLAPAAVSMIDTLFSTSAIVRSLIVFNAMFAVQTVLDATYLWGGQALPDGMTYAEYAHRGAYPLVAAALLAAGFVLIAMRPGSESPRMPFVRNLVYCWVAQTIILVGASAWRTGLYVSAYSLTYLRVAAFVWMALVAVGLVLIVLRLAWDKSGAWLIKVNMLTAMGVLYIFCFVDVGGSIAWFNVVHSRAGTAQGYSLDLDYLKKIGPPALPALDWYVKTAKTKWREESPEFFVRFNSAGALRSQLAWDLADRHGNWRAYTFRSYRLALDVANSRTELYDGPLPDGVWTVE
jgi:hypothetical protein